MKSNKKLMSCLLCLAIGLSIFLPCTALSVTASGLGFPAPVTVSAPKLLKEICVPDVNISLNGVSDAFSPELSGEVSSAAPVISGITSQVSPDSSVVIQGEGFSGGTVFVYGLNSSGEGVLKQAELLNLTDTSATALIDASFAYGMYFLWVRSASGLTSYPARINAPELTWISKTEAKPRSSVYVYGKNLSRQNLTANSYVYLTDGTDYY